MAEKKLIAKIKQHSKDKSFVKYTTENGDFVTFYHGAIHSVIVFECGDVDESELLTIDLSNLENLIKIGFTIRLGKVDETYTLIISKGNCSVTFTATKDKLIKTLQEAEEWAEAFIDELQITNHTL